MYNYEFVPKIFFVTDSTVPQKLPESYELHVFLFSPSLQFEAAWALTNIASGTSAQTQAVVNSGELSITCCVFALPFGTLIGENASVTKFLVNFIDKAWRPFKMPFVCNLQVQFPCFCGC